MARRITTAGVCIVVIAVSLYFVLRPARRRRGVDPADYRRPWVCEACGHAFVELPATGLRRCPECGKQAAVRSVRYTCGKCGHSFEAYRMKDYYGTEANTDESGQAVMPMAYYRKGKAGRWTTDLGQLGRPACPKCGNADPATLREPDYRGEAEQ